MIKFLSSWTKNIALALIIVSILEMLLPNNKVKKYIKMVMGLYILFSILNPFVEKQINIEKIDLNQYINNNKDSEKIDNKQEINQQSMDERINQMYAKHLEEDIIKKLNDMNYELETCKVKVKYAKDNSEIEKIRIKVEKKKEKDNKQNNDTEIENKIITEIQKIQKVKIKEFENSNEEEISKITKTDIKIIKDFLVKEYGVKEECLKIS